MSEPNQNTFRGRHDRYWRNLPEPLPREEQKLLFVELKDDTTSDDRKQAIRETLCLHNLRIVQQQSDKLTHTPDADEEVFPAGVCGLLKAIDRVRIENVEQFHPYASMWIRGEITRALYSMDGLKEKQGRAAGKWRRWQAGNRNGTPQQAVEDGVFPTVAQAEAAKHGAVKKHSLTAVEDIFGGDYVEAQQPITHPTVDNDNDREAARALLEETVNPQDLEILLEWAENGCPTPANAEVKQALVRARGTANLHGLRTILDGGTAA